MCVCICSNIGICDHTNWKNSFWLTELYGADLFIIIIFFCISKFFIIVLLEFDVLFNVGVKTFFPLMFIKFLCTLYAKAWERNSFQIEPALNWVTVKLKWFGTWSKTCLH